MRQILAHAPTSRCRILRHESSYSEVHERFWDEAPKYDEASMEGPSEEYTTFAAEYLNAEWY